MLSCDCEWDGPDDYNQKFWRNSSEYSEYKKLVRSRCCGCQDIIKYADIVVKVWKYRTPTEWEENSGIYGDDSEIYMSTKYLCEKCADVFFSLDELGFCVTPYEHRDKLLEEYKEYVDYRNAND